MGAESEAKEVREAKIHAGIIDSWWDVFFKGYGCVFCGAPMPWKHRFSFLLDRIKAKLGRPGHAVTVMVVSCPECAEVCASEEYDLHNLLGGPPDSVKDYE